MVARCLPAGPKSTIATTATRWLQAHTYTAQWLRRVQAGRSKAETRSRAHVNRATHAADLGHQKLENLTHRIYRLQETCEEVS